MRPRVSLFDAEIEIAKKPQRNLGIGGHQRGFVGATNEWLTPPEIIQKLTQHHGPFDLDPCSPVNRPWDTALRHFTIHDNGLIQDWSGSVFLNPPYGNHLHKWMEKMSHHHDGIALIFARTETDVFFKYVWHSAYSVLFVQGRLYFCHPDGSRAKNNSGAPSILIAYGEECDDRLRTSKIDGKYIRII